MQSRTAQRSLGILILGIFTCLSLALTDLLPLQAASENPPQPASENSPQPASENPAQPASENPAQPASENSSTAAQLAGMNLVDIDGNTHNMREWVDKHAVVFVFIGMDCPISNRYAPELNAIYKDFSSRGVSMYGVLSDRTVTQSEARKHSTDFALQFPVIIDSSIELAKTLGAKITPEAVVLTAKGVPIYRGRIDNTYITFGQMRAEPTVTDLRTVLDRAVQGITGGYQYIPSIGCSIPLKQR